MSLIAAFLASAVAATAAGLPAPPTIPYAPTDEQACNTTTVTVYFSKDTAALTEAAERALSEARDRLAGCQVDAVKATATAPVAEDTALSASRAIAVVDALTRKGVQMTRTDADLTVETASDAAPMARRIELALTTSTVPSS
ncbi:MAG: hypothetical protein AAFR94_09720 [Pseudomonadota bacterium]